jgi:hypothetical protein
MRLAYRRRRETDERERAKRERVTIVVLVATAIFAFLAAIAAGVSAWIFQGQLAETQRALQDSREALERTQSAWIGPVDAEIDPDDTPLTARPAEIRLRVIYQNTGREPAIDVTFDAIGGAVPIPPGFSDWAHLQIPQNKRVKDCPLPKGTSSSIPPQLLLPPMISELLELSRTEKMP